MPNAPPLPTTFLPRLPKSRTTLVPLDPSILLTHISTLRHILAPEVVGSLPTSADPSAEAEGKLTEEFEREWAEKWLNGVLIRGEGWIEEGYEEMEGLEAEADEEEKQRMGEVMKKREEVLREASGVITMLAGCTGTGSFVRTFPFLLSRALSHLPSPSLPLPATSTSQALPPPTPPHSDPTPSPSALLTKLLAISHQPQPSPRSYIPPPGTLAHTHRLRHMASTCASGTASPISGSVTPPATHRATPDAPRSGAATPGGPFSPPTGLSSAGDVSEDGRETMVVSLNDAALTDHLSVGVLTWASAILMGRLMAEEPETFFGEGTLGYLDEEEGRDWSEDGRERPGPRVLELGAGTGLLGILGRMLMDRIGQVRAFSGSGKDKTKGWGTVVTTDYHPLVMDNLKTCVSLNIPSPSPSAPPTPSDSDSGATSGWPGIHVLPLDWTTYPTLIASSPSRVPPALCGEFDVILVADCVYDAEHAGMIRTVVEWALRRPEFGPAGEVVRESGVVHLLGPIRPTYAAETASIALSFPSILTPGPPLSRDPDVPLPPGVQDGLRLVTVKRSELQRMRGHGRADEVEYWWWEIRWARV